MKTFRVKRDGNDNPKPDERCWPLGDVWVIAFDSLDDLLTWMRELECEQVVFQRKSVINIVSEKT
jgi:hypothetical protein